MSKLKFKVYDDSTKLPVELYKNEMIVVNHDGVFYILKDIGHPWGESHIKLSERVKSFTVRWGNIPDDKRKKQVLEIGEEK